MSRKYIEIVPNIIPIILVILIDSLKNIIPENNTKNICNICKIVYVDDISAFSNNLIYDNNNNIYNINAKNKL